ncbi:mitochondrial dicarboxylate carrier [Chytridium lagenaria]|nr:mitochondrial dicarboxylate carrier [Chytridium lagenaria]
MSPQQLKDTTASLISGPPPTSPSAPSPQAAAAADRSKSIWWFGGAASMFSALCTHPLDTLKIRLQTSTVKVSLVRTTVDIVSKEGFMALYAGVSASLLRQATYSTARFAVYDIIKAKLNANDKSASSQYKQLFAACVGGAAGGLVGSPADLTNIRMQNDGKLPIEKRRGYKNAFDGIYRIAILMTASQVASYDIIKQQMLATSFFKDNLITHFGASLSAGLIATTVCSPIDVLKTRIMTAQGMAPIITRLGPHTIITFLAYEQLKTWYSMLRTWKHEQVTI